MKDVGNGGNGGNGGRGEGGGPGGPGSPGVAKFVDTFNTQGVVAAGIPDIMFSLGDVLPLAVGGLDEEGTRIVLCQDVPIPFRLRPGLPAERYTSITFEDSGKVTTLSADPVKGGSWEVTYESFGWYGVTVTDLDDVDTVLESGWYVSPLSFSLGFVLPTGMHGLVSYCYDESSSDPVVVEAHLSRTDLSPSGVSWFSSDPSVFTVEDMEETGRGYGVSIVAHGPGEGTLLASATSDTCGPTRASIPVIVHSCVNPSPPPPPIRHPPPSPPPASTGHKRPPPPGTRTPPPPPPHAANGTSASGSSSNSGGENMSLSRPGKSSHLGEVFGITGFLVVCIVGGVVGVLLWVKKRRAQAQLLSRGTRLDDAEIIASLDLANYDDDDDDDDDFGAGGGEGVATPMLTADEILGDLEAPLRPFR